METKFDAAELQRLYEDARRLGFKEKKTFDTYQLYLIENALAILEHIAGLEKRVEELECLNEKLKMEAQIHAQEARSQRATVLEGYQIATGGKGEPGDWHGAEPIKQLQRENAALKQQLAERKVQKAKDYWEAQAWRGERDALREFAREVQPFLREVHEDNQQAGHLFPHQARDVESLLQRAEQLLKDK